MTDEAMSPLRRRMIEDMTIRKFAPKTQHNYLQRVKNFATFSWSVARHGGPWGCNYAQGFAVHRPSPHNQLVAWIERSSVKPRRRTRTRWHR